MTAPNAISDASWIEPRTTPVDALPHPTTERWQPLRLGLVDLFYYDDEQFWFHDGRLLLRGNNGTGKSKVLALTLPTTAPRTSRPWASGSRRAPPSRRFQSIRLELGRVDEASGSTRRGAIDPSSTNTQAYPTRSELVCCRTGHRQNLVLHQHAFASVTCGSSMPTGSS